MKRPEERHASEITVHSLRNTINIQKKTIARLQKEKQSLVRDTYRFPRELYETCHLTRSRDAVVAKVLEQFKEIDGDPKGWKRLVAFLDGHLDNAVSDLASFPNLTPDDIRLFCYLVIGCDAVLISALMGIDNLNTVYSRKNRLIGKIAKLGPRRAKRFLDLLE